MLRSDPDIIAVEYELKNQDRPWRETRIDGFLQAFLLFHDLPIEEHLEIIEKVASIRNKPSKWSLYHAL